MHLQLRYVERRLDRNAAADRLEPAELAHGSIGWVTQRCRGGEENRDLSPGTIKPRYPRIVTADKTVSLRLKKSRPRDRIWTDEEVALWIKVDPQITTIFLLAQRPKHVLGMARPQYSGSATRLPQVKMRARSIFPLVAAGSEPDFQMLGFKPHGAPNKRR
jgi:hypothetical protein